MSDDFDIDFRGNAYAASSNSLLRISPNGSVSVLVNTTESLLLAGVTSTRFGRRPEDRDVLYISTNGGLPGHSVLSNLLELSLSVSWNNAGLVELLDGIQLSPPNKHCCTHINIGIRPVPTLPNCGLLNSHHTKLLAYAIRGSKLTVLLDYPVHLIIRSKKAGIDEYNYISAFKVQSV